jgi:hypothetical protein
MNNPAFFRAAASAGGGETVYSPEDSHAPVRLEPGAARLQQVLFSQLMLHPPDVRALRRKLDR